MDNELNSRQREAFLQIYGNAEPDVDESFAIKAFLAGMSYATKRDIALCREQNVDNYDGQWRLCAEAIEETKA